MLEKHSISLILYKSIFLYLPCWFFFDHEKHSRSLDFCVFRTILDQNFANQHFRKGQVTSLVVNFSDQSLLWEKSRCIEIFWLLLHKRLCTILPLENLYVVCNKVYLEKRSILFSRIFGIYNFQWLAPVLFIRLWRISIGAILLLRIHYICYFWTHWQFKEKYAKNYLFM